MNLMPWRKQKSTPEKNGGEGLPSVFGQDMDEFIGRWFQDPWSLLGGELSSNAAGWVPAFEMTEGDRDVTVRAEVPGVAPEDLKVTLTDRVLTVSGEKKSAREEKGKDLYRSECSYGSFERSWELPDGVDPEKIWAEHKNGILTIRFLKGKPSAARRIAVEKK